MNVVFLFDKYNTDFLNKANEIKEYIEKNSDDYEIKVLLRNTQKKKCDIYLIISNSFDEIDKYYQKIETKERILLVTANIDTEYILNCVNIIKNITYLENSSNVIVDRMKKMYEKTRK